MKVNIWMCLLLICATSAAPSDVDNIIEEMKKMIETLQENARDDRRAIQTLQSELENLKTTSEADKEAGAATDVGDLAEEMKDTKNTILTMQAEIYALNETTAEIGGASYVRWGRKTCNGSATLVYQGHVGGSMYTAYGGGSNHVCLPNYPQFNAVVAGTTGDSVMYGVEYIISDSNYVFSKNNSNGASLNTFPAACAVCYARIAATVLTIPAHIDCPIGWTKEYQGYMMAALSTNSSYHRSEYICVDEAPESVDGNIGQGQGRLQLVEMGCGSLPCSVYVAGTELNCVVCSR